MASVKVKHPYLRQVFAAQVSGAIVDDKVVVDSMSSRAIRNAFRAFFFDHTSRGIKYTVYPKVCGCCWGVVYHPVDQKPVFPVGADMDLINQWR